MSSLYITEPPAHGKVLLQTTKGDVEIELFSKECPLACRNFIQLCLEGYMQTTSFHRIVPGFCIQAGDPTGTGTGGQSIWDAPFKDEFHARLKYNRRGLLGMANTGKPNDNGSQFFITLAATPELQERNTLFGKVVGNTIYNVDRIGKSELEESDRPRYPTRITGAQVLVNPFDDMVPRTAPVQEEAKKSVKQVVGNKRLLSFADDESELVLPKGKRKQPMPKPTLSEPPPPPVTTAAAKAGPKQDAKQIAKDTEQDAVQAQIAALEASLKRKRTTKQAEPVQAPLSALEQARNAYKQKALVGGRKARAKLGEQDTLARLSTFQSRLASAGPTHTVATSHLPCKLHGVPQCESCETTQEADVDDADFLSHQLVFKDLRGKDLTYKERMELELIDPREKAGRLALEARDAKRRQNEATGRNIFGGKR